MLSRKKTSHLTPSKVKKLMGLTLSSGRLPSGLKIPEILLAKKLPVEIKGCLVSKKPVVRAQGIAMLKGFGNEGIPLIERFLKDNSSLVRFNAIVSLTRLGSKKSMPKIIECLKDKDTSVRSEAIEFIARHGSRHTIDLLRRFLRRSSGGTQKTALAAIARLKNIG